ncbi:adenosine deaminase-like protein isoform X1 [Latimeria chalumnae]|uniref:N6-Methyl-AMP deaminase n=2 Tax=Latimeria chalumnae TaxID=7897 RepID=H3BHA7_LATCH|nr:PREDICTED: adenosine deaminase-like protein isoform X1 [Latimeria chalumnae]|eukprot:XP_005987823.1 PREDICTED: adenosine deaminase-like protein isoform X1 [Latimeria chalumnae]
MMDGEVDGFYRAFPKVELHAHLNSSISSVTMGKLIAKKPDLGIEQTRTMINKGQKRTLEECFEMFKIIHQITDRTEDIYMVTKDVIKEFAADGVKYLELRSTPREEKTGMTKRAYVETILEAIKQCKQDNVDIDVRFLLSIDRRSGSTVAKETVKLAEEFFLSSDGIVVGLDLSGDPTVGHGKDFIGSLQEARNAGLKLALHLSEIPSQHEETTLILMNLPPARIGHGTFIHPDLGGSQELVDLVKLHQIPLELCMTSNVKGQTVPSYDKHHFGSWYSLGHPCILCTDGKGVFATDLSQEYQLAASVFNLSPSQMWDISYQAIDYIFASDDIKSKLRRRWNNLRPGLLN